MVKLDLNKNLLLAIGVLTALVVIMIFYNFGYPGDVQNSENERFDNVSGNQSESVFSSGVADLVLRSSDIRRSSLQLNLSKYEVNFREGPPNTLENTSRFQLKTEHIRNETAPLEIYSRIYVADSIEEAKKPLEKDGDSVETRSEYTKVTSKSIERGRLTEVRTGMPSISRVKVLKYESNVIYEVRIDHPEEFRRDQALELSRVLGDSIRSYRD